MEKRAATYQYFFGQTNNFKLLSSPKYRTANKQKLLSVKAIPKSELNLNLDRFSE